MVTRLVCVLALGAAVHLFDSMPVVAQAPRAENAPNQFVTVGDTTFAYRSFGTGTPLVFLNRFRATMDHWDPAFSTPLP